MARQINSNQYVAANQNSGKSLFGSGFLGNVIINGHVEMSGDAHFNDLVIDDGASLSAVAEHRLIIRCKQNCQLVGSATIHADGRGEPGGNGGNGGGGHRLSSSSGAHAQSSHLGFAGGGGGAVGSVTGGDGGASSYILGNRRGPGGSRGKAGGPPAQLSSSILKALKLSNIPGNLILSAGGGGGAGAPGVGSDGRAGSGGSNGQQTGKSAGHGEDGENGLLFSGGGGGAGGAGGGSISLYVGGDLIIDDNSRISANGGNGGNGGRSGANNDLYPAGAGGGGGGGGIVEIVVSKSGNHVNVDNNHIQALGGSGGLSNGNVSGGNGEDGIVLISEVL